MDDLVERLKSLYVWPQSVADHHADTLTPRQIEKLYEVGIVAEQAAARIQALETSLAEAEGRVKWVFPKSIADMPVKPGKAAYEYVECLILRKGDMLCRPWNCEHQVFDDEAQDDFFCEWSEITAYMELTAIRALASDALLDRQGNGKEGV